MSEWGDYLSLSLSNSTIAIMTNIKVSNSIVFMRLHLISEGKNRTAYRIMQCSCAYYST